jgi:hypothetical protein
MHKKNKVSTSFSNDTDLYRPLFYKDLKRINTNNFHFDKINKNKKFDKIMPVEYKINKHGYRGEDFLKPESVLVLGCSQTFGYGMIEDFIWPNIFCNKINKKYHNLSEPGDGLQGQVSKAFAYFKEIGHPKIIVAAFPAARIEYPNIPEVLGEEDKFLILSTQLPLKDFNGVSEVYANTEKFSERPHKPQDVLPYEFGLYYNFIFIRMLEDYCKTNNIALIWTFYDDLIFIEYIKKNVPEILNNYFSIEKNHIVKVFGVDDGLTERCHQEISDHPLFERASDVDRYGKHHMGIHGHLHFAEEFYEEFIKRGLSV